MLALIVPEHLVLIAPGHVGSTLVQWFLALLQHLVTREEGEEGDGAGATHKLLV